MSSGFGPDGLEILVWEKSKSRKARLGRDNTSRSLEFWIRGATDEFQAQVALENFIPEIYALLPIQSMDIDEVLPQYLWEATVGYTVPDRNRDVGSSWLDWDTTGGQIKITNSLKTIQSYPSPSVLGNGAPNNFRGAINVSEKRVEGVDITIPAFKLVANSIMDFGVVGPVAYAKLAAGLTGTTNQTPIWQFNKDELLFLGMSGTTKKISDQQPGSEVKYHFAASQDATGLSIGDITGIKKGGNQFLWVYYQSVIDNNANAIVMQPAAVYIEQVFQSVNWSGLQLPSEAQLNPASASQ